MKGERETRKKRIYEIYGIPKNERHKHQIHHIVFKSDVKNGDWDGFNVDKKANQCPLPIADHRNLHKKIETREKSQSSG